MSGSAWQSDDLGLGVAVPPVVRRVVSLVPSLTESVALTRPGMLVAATKWCVQPPSLEVERIGGTKNPDTARVAALRPDVVLANEEENRAEDLERLRAAGLPVWVTRVRSLPEALTSLERMLVAACRLPRPAWLAEAAHAWGTTPAGAPGRPGPVTGGPVTGGPVTGGPVTGGPVTGGPAWRGPGAGPAGGGRRVMAVVPIWRRPWMVLGSDTFAGDVLARLGVGNVYAGHPVRYPRVPLAELRGCGADLVVLPDEPYPFSAGDGPEAFPGLPAALVSGRHLTWYGPSLVEAPRLLPVQLGQARRW